MPRADHGAGVRRARYNSSLIDARLLEVGEKNFNKLPDKYVIFITEKDFMKEGRAVYSYIMMEQTTHKPLGDGTHIVYVNGAYENNESDIGKLMHDFRCTDPSKMHFARLANDVDYFKNGGGQPQMCRIVEELCNESVSDHIEKSVLNMVEMHISDINYMARCAATTPDVVEKVLQKHGIVLESKSKLEEAPNWKKMNKF